MSEREQEIRVSLHADKMLRKALDNKNKIMDRERVINQIQKINCMGRNNITELANLQNDELMERLNELIKYKK